MGSEGLVSGLSKPGGQAGSREEKKKKTRSVGPYNKTKAAPLLSSIYISMKLYGREMNNLLL